MKHTVSVLALAASVAATGFRNFPPFPCPANTDNKCNSLQKPGFNFQDLNVGPFTQYNDFNWNGFTCGNSQGSSLFGRRTGGKAIGGSCTSNKQTSPSFGCGPSIDKFSLGSIHVQPEFDCDLEFHYDMPDGSTCKHRDSCSKSGTTIVNSQCGGAKNVTIVFPPQPSKPKPTCSVNVHTISFDCSPPTTTVTTPASTAPASTAPASTTPASTAPASTAPASTAPASTAPASSAPTSEAASSAPPVETWPSTWPTTTFVTSFDSTSTVFSTVVSTITSCAPTVKSCPAHLIQTTVVTVAVSTTVCPVTETHTTVLSTPASSVVVIPGTTTKHVSPPPPVETLPCPNVVPSCLNTFMFNVACKDNSDSKCYCPNTIFIKNVFDCIYAHGESDSVVSEAVIYLQGICAPFIPGNPGIATGATVTNFITVGPTPTSIGAVYTTVIVSATTVVPCTNEAGSVIPSSSSTVVVGTTLTLPQVGFTTASNSVGIVPVTLPPWPTSSYAAVPVPGPITTSFATAPVGTGGLPGTVRPSTPAIVTAGSGRVAAGFGFSLAMAVLAAVGL